MDTANTLPSVPDLRVAAEQYQAAARSTDRRRCARHPSDSDHAVWTEAL